MTRILRRAWRGHGIIAATRSPHRKDEPVTPAELRSIREALGLSLDRAAQTIGVTPRTVRAWESGRSGTSVPRDVADVMHAAYAAQADYVRAAVDRIIADPPERVSLLRYRTDEDLHAHEPNTRLTSAAHGIAQQHIAYETHARCGIPARVVWANLRDYHAWAATHPGATLQAWADDLPWET